MALRLLLPLDVEGEVIDQEILNCCGGGGGGRESKTGTEKSRTR